MEAQSHFQHGCSLFVDEDYVGALSSFNKAIEADASNEEYFIKRSTCLFKLKKFTEALADANSALKINPNSPKAYFRKGMACFSLDEFETAKAAFEKGKNLDPQDTNFSLWLRKCNAELEENENEIGEAETKSDPQTEKEEPAKPTVVEQKPEALPPSAAMSIEEAQTLPIKEEEKKPAVRHSWYQNDNFVCITFFVRERTDKDVAIKIDTKTLDVDIKLPDGGSFIFDIDLCNDVIPSESKTVINKANIEVKLKKVKTLQWGTLEYTGAVLPSINPATAENIKHVYPSSSKKKKNWDQLAAQVEEEKLEGEQALNKVFQDIYSNGSEEQRRAMLKSFVESGGTVLSTNWDDVKKAEVKGSPPKGMEVKKYNE